MRPQAASGSGASQVGAMRCSWSFSIAPGCSAAISRSLTSRGRNRPELLAITDQRAVPMPLVQPTDAAAVSNPAQQERP